MRILAYLTLAFALPLAACGGSGDDDDDGSGGGDAGPTGACDFDTDDYLPYQVGYTWTYRLTDLGTGERATKEQRIDPEVTDPTFGDVLVQVTGKIGGQTISLVRKEGDRVLRFQQEDRDDQDALERTTTYDPAQVRIDESPEHLELDAEWDETYTEVVTDPDGIELSNMETVDHWKVLAVDEACESPAGTFECVRLLRTRTQGGVAEKEFSFARGVGKVREVGSNQLEELTACGAE